MAIQHSGKTRWRDYRPGPAMLVTAAFIGPGTVTAASLAGAASGFALIWALVFAIFGAIILQNMAGRIGIMRQTGLAEAILRDLPNKGAKLAMAALMLAALVIGNAAYEGGNLGGAAAGAQILLPHAMGDKHILMVLIAAIAALFFLLGGQKLLTGLLTILVLVMSIAFIGAALSGGLDFAAILSGLVPSLPNGDALAAIALIGTTIVPYNLFLHAALTRDKWGKATHISAQDALTEMRRDTIFAISLGGLVSIAILATAATFIFANALTINSPADMAQQIQPFAGDWAAITIGIGLLSAGLTSAITAPLATALIVQEMAHVFTANGPRESDYSQALYRATGLAIIAIGATFGFADISLLSLILTAQIANGLLLPIVAILLYRLIYTGKKKPSASILERIPAISIIAVTLLLSGRQLILILEKLAA